MAPQTETVVDPATYSRLVVKLSLVPNAGEGLFTSAPIQKGTIVCEYKGTTLRTAEAMRLGDHNYLMRLGSQCFVDAREHMEVLARYINDHRNPSLYNVRLVKQPEQQRALVIATKSILAGDELYVDYGRWYWAGFPVKPSKLPLRVAAHLLERHNHDLESTVSENESLPEPPPTANVESRSSMDMRYETVTPAATVIPALTFATRFDCRGMSHRCAFCARPAACNDAASTIVELMLASGRCEPLDLVQGKVKLPRVPCIEPTVHSTERSGEKQWGGLGASSESAAAAVDGTIKPTPSPEDSPPTGRFGVWCSGGCGEVFCSALCERRFWASGHRYLCVGPLSSADHPLCRFRGFCVAVAGEEALLAAQLFAMACEEASHGGHGNEGDETGAIATVKALVSRGTCDEEHVEGDEEGACGEGGVPTARYEDEAWALLQSGLREAHGVTEDHFWVAFGARQQRRDIVDGTTITPNATGDSDPIGQSINGSYSDVHACSLQLLWRALLHQVERNAIAASLPSPSIEYCRNAMLSKQPGVLKSAELILSPLFDDLARNAEDLQAKDGNDEEAQLSTGDERGMVGDDGEDEGRGTPLWPDGWHATLLEKAETLVQQWHAIAIFPVTTKSTEIFVRDNAKLQPLPQFDGDLPHSCLPTHELSVLRAIPPLAGAGNSASVSPVDGSCLCARLDTCAYAPRSPAAPTAPSRCYVECSLGFEERREDLSCVLGCQEACVCQRCIWEGAQLRSAGSDEGEEEALDDWGLGKWHDLRRIARQALAQDRYSDALAANRQALALRPCCGDSLYDYGVCLRRLERWPDMHAHWVSVSKLLKEKKVEPPTHTDLNGAVSEVFAYDMTAAGEFVPGSGVCGYEDEFSPVPLGLNLDEVQRDCECLIGHAKASDNSGVNEGTGDKGGSGNGGSDRSHAKNVRKIFATRGPVLSAAECAFAMETAERHAAARGGWKTKRHISVPTTDIQISDCPPLLRWFKALLCDRICPLLAELYPEYVPSPSAIKVNDAFIVKYEYASCQRHLPLHTDQSTLSLTIALNRGSSDTGQGSSSGDVALAGEFAGGGTFFESLGRAIVPVQGGLVAFPGDLSHGGQQLTSGVRFIIACFLYVAETATEVP